MSTVCYQKPKSNLIEEGGTYLMLKMSWTCWHPSSLTGELCSVTRVGCMGVKAGEGDMVQYPSVYAALAMFCLCLPMHKCMSTQQNTAKDNVNFARLEPAPVHTNQHQH